MKQKRVAAWLIVIGLALLALTEVCGSRDLSLNRARDDIYATPPAVSRFVGLKYVTLTGREKYINTGLIVQPGETVFAESVENAFTTTFIPRSQDGSWFLNVNAPQEMTQARQGPQTQHISGTKIWPGWEHLYRFPSCLGAGAVAVVLDDPAYATCDEVFPFGKAGFVRIENKTRLPQPVFLYFHDTKNYWEIVGKDPHFPYGKASHWLYSWAAPGTRYVDGYASNPAQNIRFRVTILR